MKVSLLQASVVLRLCMQALTQPRSFASTSHDRARWGEKPRVAGDDNKTQPMCATRQASVRSSF